MEYIVIKTEARAASLQNALNELAQQNYKLACPLTTVDSFEVLMVKSGEEMVYQYEVGRTERIPSSIQNYLQTMGLSGYYIANSFLDGNTIVFIMTRKVEVASE